MTQIAPDSGVAEGELIERLRGYIEELHNSPNYEALCDDVEELIRTQHATIARLEAEVARCHERLEIDHVWVGVGPTHDLQRKEVPMDRRLSTPDGIECRDATIEGQKESIARLQREAEGLGRERDEAQKQLAIAVEVIERNIEQFELGVGSCDDGSGIPRCWPIRDEYLLHMHKALPHPDSETQG